MKTIALLITTLIFSVQAFAGAEGEQLEKLMLNLGSCYGESQKAGTDYNLLGYIFLPDGELEIQLTDTVDELKAYHAAYSQAYNEASGMGKFVQSKWRVVGDQVHIQLSSGWKNLSLQSFSSIPAERVCSYSNL